MKNVRNRLETEFIEKQDNEEVLQQQSKLTFKGIQDFYTIYDSYTFKQNEFLMNKLFY